MNMYSGGGIEYSQNQATNLHFDSTLHFYQFCIPYIDSTPNITNQMKKATSVGNSPAVLQAPELMYEEMIYYEAGDVIFVSYDDYFWPGKVVEVLDNYALYNLQLFVLRIPLKYALKQIIDYNTETEQKSLKLFNRRDRDEKITQKFTAALKKAKEFNTRQLKKEAESQRKQDAARRIVLSRKHKKIEEELGKQTAIHEEQKLQAPVNDITAIKPPPKKAKKEPKLSEKKGKKEKEACQQELPLHSSASPVTKQQPIPPKIQIPIPTKHSEKISKSFHPFNPQKPKKQQKTLNRDVAIFMPRPEAQIILPRKTTRHYHELTQDEQSMCHFMARYEELQEELMDHLNAITAVPEEARIKIFENTMDKLMKAILQDKNHSNGPNFMPIFRTLFEKHMISLEKMVEGVLQRILVFRNACRLIVPVPFPMEFQFFNEFCSDLRNRYVLGQQCPPPLRARLQDAFKKHGFSP